MQQIFQRRTSCKSQHRRHIKNKNREDTVGTVSPTKYFRPPNDTQKYINETDKFGIPNYWSTDGQLVVSHQGRVPSHSRTNCKLKTQDEREGKHFTVHPNRGQILSNNQAAKRLQPAEGASYKMFKKHSYYDKDRAQRIRVQSQQIVNNSEENIGWDYNHNPPSEAENTQQDQDQITEPKPSRNYNSKEIGQIQSQMGHRG